MRRFSSFTLFAAIVALICLFFSLAQPHSMRGGYVLGYSSVRLGMAVLLVVPMIFLAVLTMGGMAQRNWVQQMINRLTEWNQIDLLLTLREFALLMALLGGYLLWKWGSLPDEKGVILRLMPLLVFWTIFWLLTWVYAQFCLSHPRITFIEKLELFTRNSKKVLIGLLLMVLTAVILSLAGQLVRFHARKVYKLVEFLVYEFDLGGERNLPTFFNVFLLAAGGILSLIIGAKHQQQHKHFTANWLVVGAIFLLLAYDDLEQVHESLTGPLHDLLHTSGLFTFAWVIPAIGLVGLFAFLNLRFLFSLPKQQQILLLAAALIYVGGALGVEMLGGAYVEEHGIWNFNTILLANLEEVMELGGASLFIYFLLESLKLETT